jgi:hypothetical protein
VPGVGKAGLLQPFQSQMGKQSHVVLYWKRSRRYQLSEDYVDIGQGKASPVKEIGGL